MLVNGGQSMKVAVVGLWHLGCVTATCLTEFGHTVIAYDEDASTYYSFKTRISHPSMNLA